MVNYETFKLNSPKQWRKLVVNARLMMEMQCINGVVNLNDCLCSLLGEYRAAKACTLLTHCCRQDEYARQVAIMSKLQTLPLQFKISDCKNNRECEAIMLNQIRKQDEAEASC